MGCRSVPDLRSKQLRARFRGAFGFGLEIGQVRRAGSWEDFHAEGTTSIEAVFIVGAVAIQNDRSEVIDSSLSVGPDAGFKVNLIQ
jgi:hypothetical protein